MATLSFVQVQMCMQGVCCLQKSGIPHTTQAVKELFNLVDIDGSGIMEWSGFETFVANEIQEGRDFMEGEFVLPSGAGIQFAAMVDVLRRKSRLQAVMKVSFPCYCCHDCKLPGHVCCAVSR